MNFQLLKQQMSAVSSSIAALIELQPYLPELIRLAEIGQAAEDKLAAEAQAANEATAWCDAEASQHVSRQVEILVSNHGIDFFPDADAEAESFAIQRLMRQAALAAGKDPSILTNGERVGIAYSVGCPIGVKVISLGIPGGRFVLWPYTLNEIRIDKVSGQFVVTQRMPVPTPEAKAA